MAEDTSFYHVSYDTSGTSSTSGHTISTSWNTLESFNPDTIVMNGDVIDRWNDDDDIFIKKKKKLKWRHW